MPQQVLLGRLRVWGICQPGAGRCVLGEPGLLSRREGTAQGDRNTPCKTRLFSAEPSQGTGGGGRQLQNQKPPPEGTPRGAWHGPEPPAPTGAGAARPHLPPPPAPLRGGEAQPAAGHSPPLKSAPPSAGRRRAEPSRAEPRGAGRSRAVHGRAGLSRAEVAMAIAHIATEYVFSDFLLKEPPETRYKGLRLELALDKIVTCIAVGLPLLLISLAFAQEVSIGAQISCFAPSSFSWRQAAYVDSYCWAAVQQKQPSQNNLENIPLWLHKFFPYILLLVAILLYLPCLFWRFTAAPHLSSDLKFIMEELDKAYNRAIKAANSIRSGEPRDPTDLVPVVNENLTQSLWEISESHFKYPIVEQYLKTKKNSKCLIIKYIICRLLTLVIIFIACLYLGYYISLSSLSDEFLCTIKTGILKNDTTVPEVVQCKLIAVGVFKVLSYINLLVYLLVMPLVVYAMFVPWRWNSGILKVYEILPTFDVLKLKSKCFDDLSLYLLFLEENVSELKSFKCLKVLENIAVSEKFDVMQLLVNLGTIKTDTVDGKPGTAVLEKPEETTTEEMEKNSTELQVLTDHDAGGNVSPREDKKLRQRLIDSSC